MKLEIWVDRILSTCDIFIILLQDTSGQLFSALELTFSIDLSLEEGGGSVELVKNGRDMEVNATNVYNYVRKYSQYRHAVVNALFFLNLINCCVHAS